MKKVCFLYTRLFLMLSVYLFFGHHTYADEKLTKISDNKGGHYD